MTIINLRDFYYWYTQDEYMEVTDDVAEALRASVRYEAAYQRRLSRHKAQYLLDCDDGIEYSACLRELTPDEVLELKERFCRLWNALNLKKLLVGGSFPLPPLRSKITKCPAGISDFFTLFFARISPVTE